MPTKVQQVPIVCFPYGHDHQAHDVPKQPTKDDVPYNQENTKNIIRKYFPLKIPLFWFHNVLQY